MQCRLFQESARYYVYRLAGHVRNDIHSLRHHSPRERVPNPRLRINEVGEDQNVGYGFGGGHGKLAAIIRYGLGAALESLEERGLVQQYNQGVEPAVEEKEICALIYLHVMLEVEGIEVELGRKTLVYLSEVVLEGTNLLA